MSEHATPITAPEAAADAIATDLTAWSLLSLQEAAVELEALADFDEPGSNDALALLAVRLELVRRGHHHA